MEWVFNVENHLPIEGITVVLLPQNKTVLTDENGQFRFVTVAITSGKIEFFGYWF